MKKAADIIKRYKNVQYVELLPFHKLGAGKYRSLDMRYDVKDIKHPPVWDTEEYFAKNLACRVICKNGPPASAKGH